jgi:HTH-type transcriptional regulator/antitoxin HigA
MKHTINTKKEYHETMVIIYNLMNKGETNLTESELKKLAAMSEEAERFEDEVLQLKPKNN